MAVTRTNVTLASAISGEHLQDNPQLCDKCNGCGKLDSLEGKPWSRFQKVRDARVASGAITPVNCQECASSGYTTQAQRDAKQAANNPPPAPAPVKAAPLPRPAKKK